jgi:two-component system, OmpR family, response regulator RegX3
MLPTPAERSRLGAGHAGFMSVDLAGSTPTIGALTGRIHVVVLERDPRTEGGAASVLRGRGITVTAVREVADVLAVVDRDRAHVVLVDGSSDGQRGVEECRQLRERTELPICLVSPSDDEFDVVLALELGADAFMVKPVRPHELVARIMSLVRRTSTALSREQLLRSGGVEIDLERHEVRVSGMIVELTLKEFTLLCLLVHHSGRAVRREFLVDRLWGDSERGSFKTLSAHIHRLREVIEDDPERPVHLVTIRGFGYRYIPAI